MLNACFGMSSASSLRQALESLGKEEFVTGYPDNLAMGPIAEIQGQERKEWLLTFYGNKADLTSQLWSESCEFWQKLAGSSTSTLRVWLSRRCTFEVAAFLHFVSSVPHNYEFELVDLSDTFINEEPFANGLGVLAPDELADGFRFCRHASASEFEADSENWKLLQSQNSNLRAFSNRKLVSVPDDYFDGTILRHAMTDWKRAAYIVGKSLVDEDIQPGTIEVSDSWLFDRVWRLVDSGQLEAETDVALPGTRIRLKQ